ncbi:DUF2759 domain-containing protein [Macrococcus brunensis]|uniref:DUF2759 domain-containing protein n=1 Tax=Macrococcus brunensis TaxID=198483 RepID=A0A4R6BDS1_9STAP|nr:DUF2759 domain-containing protein [Macrococcus brunensis]TDL97889.1 DUF2759 domain-containing protein [Macrococcus brunensis]ULG71096.1 DUF2759 domain-containing protein [Macrococcus brunensis]
MPFIDSGKLGKLFGIDIHIGVNIFAILMFLVFLFALKGLMHSFKTKNILGIIFGLLAAASFGFFSIATMLTYGYPILHH